MSIRIKSLLVLAYVLCVLLLLLFDCFLLYVCAALYSISKFFSNAIEIASK